MARSCLRDSRRRPSVSDSYVEADPLRADYSVGRTLRGPGRRRPGRRRSWLVCGSEDGGLSSRADCRCEAARGGFNARRVARDERWNCDENCQIPEQPLRVSAAGFAGGNGSGNPGMLFRSGSRSGCRVPKFVPGTKRLERQDADQPGRSEQAPAGSNGSPGVGHCDAGAVYGLLWYAVPFVAAR